MSLQSLVAADDFINYRFPTKHIPIRETSLMTWHASPLAQVHD